MDGDGFELEEHSDDETKYVPKLRRRINECKCGTNFSPELNYDELDIMLEHLKPQELNSERNEYLTTKLFQTAFDSKVKKGKIQFGSLQAAIYPNHGLLLRVTKRNFHSSQ